MHIPSLLAIIATLSIGADAAYHCRCHNEATTKSCCSKLGYTAMRLNDRLIYCYANNLAGVLPQSYPMKTCCGGDQGLAGCI
nr:uncharacterized protein CTRU02_15289 [Colletotrichum truncatum]KAF6781194.1 hypothetical protein CTRU02_15289 [Colletotrichum truncatum]